MQGLEYCGGNGVWTNKEVHSPTSPPSHLSLISPPPPPAYFPCMNRARECKLRPALQRVCTHLPFSVSFCTDDVCHKCSADWIVPYGEWRCFVNIELFPKMSQSSLHYHIIRPPTAGFYSSQELSFLSPHTRGNALKPSGSGSGIYHYIHLEKGRFGVFLHMPDRLVTPLPGRVCDLILMTS